LGSPSPTELKSAVESLSRIRALESEPDSSGGRTLFHRSGPAAPGVDLISRVDGDGKVERQELFFFGDYLLWTRTSGLKSGVAPTGTVEQLVTRGGGPATGISFDSDDAVTAERLAGVVEALKGYSGDDRLIDHAKQLFVVAAEGKPFTSGLVVTRTEHALTLEALRAAAEDSGKREAEQRATAQKAVLVVFGLAMLIGASAIVLWIVTR
jgi:hypothetical protein